MSLTEKLETKRVAGMIQECYRVEDEIYVDSTPDPKSNYLPIEDIKINDIKDPIEMRIAKLVYDALYLH